MSYGVIQAGRVALREDSSLDLAVGEEGAKVSLSGQESFPRLTLAQLQRRVDDFVALSGQLLPLTFSQKPYLNGYYWVDEASARYEEWQPEAVAIMPWKLQLTRAGYHEDLDLESRLSGPTTRANDHAATGERWHAPPLAHTAYSAGSTVPSVVTRTTTDGALTVYRNVSTGVHPRWAVAPASYGGARCRYIDSAGHERMAVRAPLPATGWQMHNGLVRASVGAGGTLDIAAWTGGAWQSKLYDVWFNSESMGPPHFTTLLRNDYEAVSLRLTRSLAPGRITVDLTLRRGSRFVELYVQHQYGANLRIVRNTVEAATTQTGYIVATAADGAGNKFVLGSSRSFVANNIDGGITRVAESTLDAFIGVEVAAAPAGDQAADLFAQYLGVPSEVVRGVRR